MAAVNEAVLYSAILTKFARISKLTNLGEGPEASLAQWPRLQIETLDLVESARAELREIERIFLKYHG